MCQDLRFEPEYFKPGRPRQVLLSTADAFNLRQLPGSFYPCHNLAVNSFPVTCSVLDIVHSLSAVIHSRASKMVAELIFFQSNKIPIIS